MTSRLVERYGSPLYVYDLARVDRAATDLRAALPDPATVYYSMKANPHPGLARRLLGHGCLLEVSSLGELRASLLGGARGADLLYTGPAKTDAEMDEAIGEGVRRFSAESFAELSRLGRIAAHHAVDVSVLLRVNSAGTRAGGGLRMTATSSQFGIDACRLQDRWAELSLPACLRFAGLHFFPATNVVEEERLIEEVTHSIEVAAGLVRSGGPELEVLDLGGGFAAPYAADGCRPAYPRLRGALVRSLDVHFPHWRANRPRIAFESGRYLVADAGTLFTTVIDVKRSRDRTFVVLDAGINVLGGMSGLGRLLPMAIRPRGGRSDGPAEALELVGPTCSPIDVLAHGVRMPPPRPGDVLAVPNVGAYGLSASLVGFLSRPLPAEVLVDGDRVVEQTRLALTRHGDRHD